MRGRGLRPAVTLGLTVVKTLVVNARPEGTILQGKKKKKNPTPMGEEDSQIIPVATDLLIYFSIDPLSRPGRM